MSSLTIYIFQTNNEIGYLSAIADLLWIYMSVLSLKTTLKENLFTLQEMMPINKGQIPGIQKEWLHSKRIDTPKREGTLLKIFLSLLSIVYSKREKMSPKGPNCFLLKKTLSTWEINKQEGKQEVTFKWFQAVNQVFSNI